MSPIYWHRYVGRGLAALSLTIFASPLYFWARASESSPQWWLVAPFAPLTVVWMALIYRLACLFLAGSAGIPHEWTRPSRVVSAAMFGVFGRSDYDGPESGTRASGKPVSPSTLALLAATIGLIGALAVDGGIQLALARRIVPPVLPQSWRDVVLVLVNVSLIAPALETAAMALMLESTRLRITSQTLALISASIWALIHGLTNHWLQAISMFWLFWVLSRLYLGLRSGSSVLKSCSLTFMAHAVNNIVALIIALSKS